MTTPHPADRPESDALVVVNARVWTGNPRRPWADAVAVRGDRLAAVSSGAEVRKLAAGARVVDAGGALLVPAALGVHAQGAEAARGSDTATLVREAMADFVLLDRALPSAAPELVRGARARMIVLAGRVVAELTDLTG